MRGCGLCCVGEKSVQSLSPGATKSNHLQELGKRMGQRPVSIRTVPGYIDPIVIQRRIKRGRLQEHHFALHILTE